VWWWRYIVLWSPSFWQILINYFFPYLHVIGSNFGTPFGDVLPKKMLLSMLLIFHCWPLAVDGEPAHHEGWMMSGQETLFH